MLSKKDATVARRKSVAMGLVVATIFTAFGQLLQSEPNPTLEIRYFFGLDVTSWPHGLTHSMPLNFLFMALYSTLVVRVAMIVSPSQQETVEDLRHTVRVCGGWLLLFSAMGGVIMGTVQGWLGSIVGFIGFGLMVAGLCAAMAMLFGMVWLVSRLFCRAKAQFASYDRQQSATGVATLVHIVSDDVGVAGRRVVTMWRYSWLMRYFNGDDVPPNR